MPADIAWYAMADQLWRCQPFGYGFDPGVKPDFRPQDDVEA
jgi:hypothetical protein